MRWRSHLPNQQSDITIPIPDWSSNTLNRGHMGIIRAGDDFAAAFIFVLSAFCVYQRPIGIMKEKSSHTIFHPTLHDRVLASFPTQAESKGDGLYRRPCTLVERELCGQPPDLVAREAVISASETRTVATTAWML